MTRAATLSLFPGLPAKGDGPGRAESNDPALAREARIFKVAREVRRWQRTEQRRQLQQDEPARPVDALEVIVERLRVLQAKHAAEDAIQREHRERMEAHGHVLDPDADDARWTEREVFETEPDARRPRGHGPGLRRCERDPSPHFLAWWRGEVEACAAYARREFRERAAAWFCGRLEAK